MKSELHPFSLESIKKYLDNHKSGSNPYDKYFYLENGSIIFNSILIEEALVLSKTIYYGDGLKFINCELRYISQGMFNGLEFENTKVDKIDIIKTEKSQFNHLLIDSESKVSFITVNDIKVNNISIRYSNILSLDIRNSKTINEIEILGSEIYTIIFQKSSVQFFNIIGLSKIDSFNLTSEVEIFNIYLIAIIKSFINFEGSSVVKLDIDDLSKIGVFRMMEGSKI